MFYLHEKLEIKVPQGRKIIKKTTPKTRKFLWKIMSGQATVFVLLLFDNFLKFELHLGSQNGPWQPQNRVFYST